MPRLIFDYFYADATSPSGIRWKVNRYGHNGSVQVAAGSVAGTSSKRSGYWQVRLRIDGIRHHWQAHRILWELTYGIEPKEVDHVDGNRLNNSLSNLREVDSAVNARNRLNGHDKPYNAPTGVTLTEYERYGRQYRYWVATWYPETGTKKTKVFSTSKLGETEAYEAACSYREERMEEIKDRLGYTDRHGGSND